jgi:short-subunit dehydrogenase
MKPAIVVTGASSGIGRELALLAAQEGSFMLLIARSESELAKVAERISASGAEVGTLCLDLSDSSVGARIERELSTRYLYCDVLVNSAGFGLFGRAVDLDPGEQIQLLDVNARALTDLTLRFLPGMVRRRRGGVLNVGSITGYVAGPNMALYFASKAYVRSFSAALAAEVAGTGVAVTCLTPGIVRTAFFQRCALGETWLFKLAPRANADQTARAGWRAFKAGRRRVIPGLMNRVIVCACLLIPDVILLWLISKMQRPKRPGSGKVVASGVRQRLDH